MSFPVNFTLNLTTGGTVNCKRNDKFVHSKLLIFVWLKYDAKFDRQLVKSQDHGASEEAEWNNIGIVSFGSILWFELDAGHDSRFIRCSFSAVTPVNAISTRIPGWTSWPRISRYQLWNNSSATSRSIPSCCSPSRSIYCRFDTTFKSVIRNTVTRVIVHWWSGFKTHINLKKASITMLTRVRNRTRQISKIFARAQFSILMMTMWKKSYLTTVIKGCVTIECELS